MPLDCQFCKKTFRTKSVLIRHQKTAKYCIKLQNGNSDIQTINYYCSFCTKKYTSNENLLKHQKNCITKYEKITLEKNSVIEKLKSEVSFLKDNLFQLKTEINILERLNDPVRQKETHLYIQELQNNIQEIALAAIEQKNDVITNMVKKYVKKQPRKQIVSCNVIYILTTPTLQRDRRYILGKSKNLTNRLSTYNKSDEHEIIFYQECEDEDTMNSLEIIVFQKLKEFREQANRERFKLPENKNIDFFIDIIKKCFEFLK